MINLSRWVDFLVGVPILFVLAPFRKKGSGSPDAYKKILVIKLAAAGDSVLLIPVLREFRKVHPQAEIHWLVTPINVAIAKNVKYVDRIVLWDKRLGGSFLRLIWSLRSEKYDAVVDVEQWSRGTALLAFLTGAQVLVGFNTPGQYRSFLFTDVVMKKFDRHEIYDFYDLFSLLGKLNPSPKLEPMDTDSGQSEVDEFLRKRKKAAKYVVLHPGCGSDGKPREWPLTSYAVLGHWLMLNYDTDIVLTSGPEERKKTMDLNKLLNGKALDLGGKLSWDGLIALINRADLVVSGNTGVMHVAAALGKKQVALHGPTNPKIWGPLNSRAKIVSSPCPQCPCLKLGFEYHDRTSSCMDKISTEEVKSVISSLFDKP